MPILSFAPSRGKLQVNDLLRRREAGKHVRAGEVDALAKGTTISARSPRIIKIAITLALASFVGSLNGWAADSAQPPPPRQTPPPRQAVEKVVNLDIAQRVGVLLEQSGMGVVLTRTTDATRSPQQRVMVADRVQADAFVSVHNNAAAARTADHAEVYRQIAEGGSLRLANRIADALTGVSVSGERAKVKARRGSSGDYYWQLRLNRSRPAVIVESAFISNPRQAWQLGTSAEYRQRIAQAIADGILSYQRSLAAPIPAVAEPSVRTRSDAIPPPEAFRAVAQSRSTVSLTWRGTTAIGRYLVYRDGVAIGSVATGAAITAIATPSALSMGFTDRWAAPGQRYAYHVEALRDAPGLEQESVAAAVSSPASTVVRTPALTICIDPGHGGDEPGAVGRW